jgi:hypothetical protein
VLAENGEAFADVGDVGVGVRLVGVAEDGGGLSGQGGNESRELADNARVWRSEPRHLSCHLLGRDVLAGLGSSGSSVDPPHVPVVRQWANWWSAAGFSARLS